MAQSSHGNEVIVELSQDRVKSWWSQVMLESNHDRVKSFLESSRGRVKSAI